MMVIVETGKKNVCKLGDLAVGSVFLYDGNLYIIPSTDENSSEIIYAYNFNKNRIVKLCADTVVEVPEEVKYSYTPDIIMGSVSRKYLCAKVLKSGDTFMYGTGLLGVMLNCSNVVEVFGEMGYSSMAYCFNSNGFISVSKTDHVIIIDEVRITCR